MKVLSVWEPYASLLAAGLKDVENRDWYTNHRGPLLIHASKTWEEEAVDWILDRLEDTEMRNRLLIGKSAFPLGGIVGVVNMIDCVTESDSEWFCGKYGWVFDKAIELPFMPLLGQRGLFDAPSEIVNQVKAEFARRKAERKAS